MKRNIFYSMMGLAVVFCMMSCDGNPIKKMQATNDSLSNLTDKQQAELMDLSNTMDFISATMDSINAQEGQLFLADNGKETTNDRATIKRKLDAFQELLKTQKEKLADLQKKLDEKGVESTRLKNLIKLMEDKLDQQDKEITQLRTELESSKKSIAELKTNVENLTVENTNLQTNVTELNEKTQAQEEVITKQDEQLNEGYVRIGSKKELQAAGLMTKGSLFKKSKANLSGISKEGFKKIDIRHYGGTTIQGKKVQIITPAPANSYSLTDNDGTWTLTITNPTAFWSVSNFLVIRAD